LCLRVGHVPCAKSGGAAKNLDLDIGQRLYSTIPAFLWGASPDGAVEFLNQRGLDYTGLTLEQIRGWNWRISSILHPDDLQTVFDQWRAVVASGREGEIQARMRRFDGEYKWRARHARQPQPDI